jgi:hypothetical protein
LQDLELERQNREAAEFEVQKLHSQFVAYERSVNELRKEVFVVTEVTAVETVQSDLKQNVEQIRKDYELVSFGLHETFLGSSILEPLAEKTI